MGTIATQTEQQRIVTVCPPLLDKVFVGSYLHGLPDGGFVLNVANEPITFGPEYRSQLKGVR